MNTLIAGASSLIILLAGTLASATLPPLPEGFITVDRGHCRFSLPARNAGVLDDVEETCGEPLERIYEQLGVLADLEGVVVRVRIIDDPEKMKTLSPVGAPPPPWAAAVAYPQEDLIILPLLTRGGRRQPNLEAVLEHEISHLALRKVLRGAAVPRWLSEGIAIAQSEMSSFSRIRILWQATKGERLVPLEEMESYPDRPGRVNLDYAQAADFVGFIIKEHGWFSIRVLLRDVAGGMDFKQAFVGAFGESVASAEKRWQASLTGGTSWLVILGEGGFVWGIIVALFLAAYLLSRRAKKKRLAKMDDEESSLEEVIGELQTGFVAKRPRKRTKRPPIPTKIRVDDDIHTLH